MRTPLLCFLLLVPLASSGYACSQGEAPLGGAGDKKTDDAAAQPAPKCDAPKWWTDPTAEGVALATLEKDQQIGELAVDDAYVYYLLSQKVSGSPYAPASQLMRVSIAGGAPEPLATPGYFSSLTLRGNDILLEDGPAVVSIPKSGGPKRTIGNDTGFVLNDLAVDEQGELYVSRVDPMRNDQVRILHVGSDGSMTPVVSAPNDIAPEGVAHFAVRDGQVAWMPSQSHELSPEDKWTGDAVVYVTDVASPSSRITLYGPYSGAYMGGLAMDESHVYFGSKFGFQRADPKVANSAVPFGPQAMPQPARVVVDGDMVYWQTLPTIPGTPPQEGDNTIGRVPKQGGAGEWLAEFSLGYDWPSLATSSCTIVWRGLGKDGRPTIFARPKSAPGRDAPTPIDTATTSPAP